MTRSLPVQAAGTACHTIAIDRLEIRGTQKDLCFEQTLQRGGGRKKPLGRPGLHGTDRSFFTGVFSAPDMINNPFV